MRIGILSDTHLMGAETLDNLGPQCAEFLSTVDLILHAGDIMIPATLDWCERFAPVLAVRGNNDFFDDPRMERRRVLEYEGWRIGVVHDVEGVPPNVQTLPDLKRHVYGADDLDILIAGDSHYERLEYKEQTLLMDTASPNLPHLKSTRLGSMGLLELSAGRVHSEIVVLGETPGAPNPVTSVRLEFDRTGILGVSVDHAPVEVTDGRFRWRPSGAPRLPV
jgi:putative phosphoesterase